MATNGLKKEQVEDTMSDLQSATVTSIGCRCRYVIIFATTGNHRGIILSVCVLLLIMLLLYEKQRERRTE